MSETRKALVLWFENLRKTDIPVVGGKNASLGEMIHAGMPVPPGFAVTAYAYEKFLKQTRIAKKIYKIIKETITDQMIQNSMMPPQRKYANSSKSLQCLKK